MMTNHLEPKEGTGTLEKRPEFTRIFFSVQIETLGRFWNSVEVCGIFQNE